MLEGAAEYSPEFVSSLNTIMKKKKNKNKRRFNDEQIRSLEVMFESGTKLEPKKKVELARQLGLQPRQVAIWFQNKRARWKSKHVEKEYNNLLADYNTLASKFETLMKEKQSLLIQLQKLKNEKEGKCDENKTQCSIQEGGAGSDGESNNCKIDFEVKNLGLEAMVSDDDRSIKAEYLDVDEEENELLKMAADSSLTSVEDWGSIDSDDMINQASDESFQWWEFWS